MDRYGGKGWMSRGMLPLLGLHAVSEFHRSGQTSPVTAGILLANTIIYLRPGPLHRILPSVNQIAFNPHLIVKYGNLKRFFLSAFYHLNESHLVYNMMSLLWKGIQLESSLGSVEFASMIAALLGLSQGITLILAKGLLIFFDYRTAYYNQYSVGFSGVLFALKVVLNAQSDGDTYMHGMIPARHAAWAELILMQLFEPGVSFLGHLGGILAGLLYLQLRGSSSGHDPLTALLGGVARVASLPMRAVRSLFRYQNPQISGRGTVGRSTGAPDVWRCQTCTYNNFVWQDVCEMCSTERRGHEFSPMRGSDRSNVFEVEELHRRRIESFDR